MQVSRLSAATSEFRAALVEAFVRPQRPDLPGHGDSLRPAVRPLRRERQHADTVVTPDSLHPLHGLLVLAVYGLAGLVFGLFVWVGIPVLILSFAVWLSKLSVYR